MTKQLSPAAEAVLNAVTEAQYGSCYTQFERISSAVLRAAADQVVPMALCVHNDDFVYVRHQLHAIADELESQ